MYQLIVWDVDLADKTGDGKLYEANIPLNLARIFFSLDKNTFPLLSSLSLDDFDLFSDEQLDQLIDELMRMIGMYNSHQQEIDNLIDALKKAKNNQKKVLFDPFRGMKTN